MAMVKAGLAGAALGALALATVIFVAPIAAQGPGGPYGPPGGPYGPPSGPYYGPDAYRGAVPPRDYLAPRGQGSTGAIGRGGDVTGPNTMNRRGVDPNDPDITGPRGAVADCQERLTRMAQARLERIALLVRPTEEQRGAFEELRMASAKGDEILRAACPAERPLTPTARMAAAEKWLEARLQAIRITRPALDSFYRLLSDEQKIRWSMGPQIDDRFAQDPRGRWDDRRSEQPGRGWDRRSDDDRRGDDRRGEERWREERRGERDRYGDERGRSGDERYSERWRERYRGRDDR
jgi:LTXXQ motif family protein